MSRAAIVESLKRRLPGKSVGVITRLAGAYEAGVAEHAIERTTGTGPVPTTLTAERAALVVAVCRKYGSMLQSDEIAALLRITDTAAVSVSKLVIAVYDDISTLVLDTAFTGASSTAFTGSKRGKRGTLGRVINGNRVCFPTDEAMRAAARELGRLDYRVESGESTLSMHELYIDKRFVLPTDVMAP